MARLSVPSGGSFITPNSGQDESNGVAGEANDIDFVEGVHDYVEVEYSWQVIGADVNDNDTIRLRVVTVDNQTAPTAEFTVNKVGGPAFTQSHFRIRSGDDQGLNVDAGWQADEDISASMAILDLPFRIRFQIVASASVTEGFQLRCSVGGGAYELVPNNADPYDEGAGGNKYQVEAIPSSQYVDLAATTQLLTGSGPSFEAGDGNEDNTSGTVVFNAVNDFTEMEWCINIRKLAMNMAGTDDAHSADGQTFDFRVYKDDGTALDTYTVTPRITIANRAGHIGGTEVESPRRAFIADKSGNLYYLTEYADLANDIANKPVIMKSADGGDSWNPVDEAGAPDVDGSDNDLEATDMDYVAADDEIYIIMQGGNNDDVQFWSFNCADHPTAADQWALDQTVDTAATPGQQQAAINKRSDGTIVGFYGDNDGSDRIRYRIRSAGGTWGGENNLDGEASTNITSITTVMDPANDTIHIFYHTWDNTNGEIWHRTLNSSDVLSGRTRVDQGITVENNGGSDHGVIVGAVIWDEGATRKVGVAYRDDVGDNVYWNESPVSSINWTTDEQVALSNVDNNTIGGGWVEAWPAVDDVADDIWVMGIDGTNQRLKYDQRIGGTWQGDTDWDTDVEKRVRALVFTHAAGNGGQRVLGFIHFDYNGFTFNFNGGNGFARYDEIVLSTGQTVAVGVASESDVAQAVAAVKPIIEPVTAASENEVAQASAPTKAASVGVSSESETAQLIDPLKPIIQSVTAATESEIAQVIAALKPIIQSVLAATESETAQAVAAVKPIIVTIGAAGESEAAQTVSPTKSVTIGGASESEAAQVVGTGQAQSIAVGVASESDAAQIVVPFKTAAIGGASESETAQLITALKPIIEAVNAAIESESAQVIAALKPIIVTIGAAGESEAAQLIDPLKPIIEPVGVAGESEAAQAITAVKPIFVTIGAATENESAQVISVGQAGSFPVGVASESESAQAIAALKPIIEPVGGASESETAQAVAAVKPIIVAVGPAGESEVAQTLSAAKFASVGSATESEVAQALNAVKTALVGSSSESEAAQLIDPLKPIIEAVGAAVESEAAQVVAVDQAGSNVVAVGVASESEAAQAISALKPIFQAVGVASESEVAEAIVGGKSVSIGSAGETEVAQLVVPQKFVAVGFASETEAAQFVDAVKPIFVPIGTAFENEAAQVVNYATVVTIGAATETEQAFTIDILKIVTIGAATETEVAHATGAGFAGVGDDAVLHTVEDTVEGRGVVVVSRVAKLYSVKKIRS